MCHESISTKKKKEYMYLKAEFEMLDCFIIDSYKKIMV